jgi:hypothetical protein
VWWRRLRGLLNVEFLLEISLILIFSEKAILSGGGCKFYIGFLPVSNSISIPIEKTRN